MTRITSPRAQVIAGHHKGMDINRKAALGAAAAGLVVGSGLLMGAATQATPPPVSAATQAKTIGPSAAQRAAANRHLAAYSKVADRSYWTMAPGNNCTNYVAWRLISQGLSPNVTWLHNGSEWGHEAKEHRIPVNNIATPGSIAQWNSGTPGSASGHVAYVEAVGPGWILVSEDNYASGPRHLEVFREGTPEWPTNFIHFRTSSLTSFKAGSNVQAPEPSTVEQWLHSYYSGLPTFHDGE